MQIEHTETTPATVEPLLFRSIDDGPLEASVLADTADKSTAAVEADLAASLLMAREQGMREALRVHEEQREAERVREHKVLERAMQQFREEKQRYFTNVESEVVQLSLAIAERVLHREAAMDPTLLAGAARVALDQIADSSEAVLHVPEGEVERWDGFMHGKSSLIVETDAALQCGEAVLKTRSGTIQLGLRAQLQEIERGFFELMSHRPALAV